MAQICHVNARLLNEDGTVVPAGVRVDLMDEDPISDDFLGTSTVGEDGAVAVVFNLEDAKSLDTPFETEPDLYFRVQRGSLTLVRSKTRPNVQFLNQLQGKDPSVEPTVNLGDVILSAEGRM